MELQSIVSFFAIVILGLVWYSYYNMRNKIHCVFRRADGTKVEKLRPLNSHYVIFEGGKYTIDPSKRTIMMWARGIHSFFPIPIFSYDFSYYSPNPLNPATFSPTWNNPENRKKLDMGDALGAFLRHAPSVTGKKQGTFEKWMPYVAIVAVVIVGFMVFQQGQHIDIMQQQIENLAQGMNVK